MDTWSEPEIPFFMDEVDCESDWTNFLSCSSTSNHDCGHSENVLLTCFTGKHSLTFSGFVSDFILLLRT